MKEQGVKKQQGIYNPMRQTEQPLKKRLFTVPEASSYLGRSVNAIRELIWAGSLPSVRFGRRVHLDIYDLDIWIQQNKTLHKH